MIAFAALCTALAAALSARSIGIAIARAFARYRERYGIDSVRDLREALPLLGADDVRSLGIGAGLAGACAGAWMGGPLGAVAGCAMCGALPACGIGWLRTRRIRRFDEQLVDALEPAAAGLQAGLSLQQALEAAAGASAAPLREELGLALREIRMGAAPDAAFASLAARVESEELALFVAGTAVARQMGGNLATSWRTIAASLRERFRVEGKLRALTAQGRLQGWVVGLLPIGLALVIHRMRPDLVEPMLAHPFGWALGAAVVLLETLGFVWIRRLLTPVW